MTRSARNNPDTTPVYDLIPADARKRGKRRGRPLHGASPRVRLFASVAAQTAVQVEAWRGDDMRTGNVIDQLVAHGLASRWEPKGAVK